MVGMALRSLMTCSCRKECDEISAVVNTTIIERPHLQSVRQVRGELMFQSILLQAGDPGMGGMVQTGIMIGLMFLVFWLLVWRPQRKEQNRLDELLKALKVGDEVVTASGILGRVLRLNDKVVTLEISKGNKMKVLRSQIQGLQSALLTEGAED